MLPPIEPKILASAFSELLRNIIDIELFNDEFKNTAANCFYWRSFIAHHGLIGLDFVRVGKLNDMKFAAEYQFSYIANGANDVIEITKTMKGFSKGDREYWTQVFLDQKKYNIKEAGHKSLLRRSIERPFARPFPEHKGLWLLMTQPLVGKNPWASK